MNWDIINFLSLFTKMEVECPDWVASLSKVALRQINPMIPNFSDYTFAFTSYNDKYGLV